MKRKCTSFLLSIFVISWLAIPLIMSAFSAYAEQEDLPFQLMPSDIEQSVSEALTEAKLGDHVRATLTSAHDSVLHAGHRPAHVELKTLEYDTEKNSWSANMLIMDGEEVITAKPISGRYHLEQGLPVLKTRIEDGKIISKQDIVLQYFPTTKVRQDSVTDVNQLIGKTPRRIISANRPIRIGEIVTPAVIEKGSVINMRYQTRYMEISTIGEALEKGAIGDYIRVRNQDSNKIVRARIVSPENVVVGMTGATE